MRVNEKEARYERPRVNVKVERGSTFTFTRDLPYIVSILFTRALNLRAHARKTYPTVEIHPYSQLSLSKGNRLDYRPLFGK